MEVSMEGEAILEEHKGQATEKSASSSNLSSVWTPLALMMVLAGLLCLNSPFMKVATETASDTRLLQSIDGPITMTIGAFYYPWYGHNFHRGDGYVRRNLAQSPQLGEYDDTDSRVIEQHLRWSRYANIGLWVTSWWGANLQEDNTTKNVILNAVEGTTHKIALLYETLGRMKGENGTQSTHRIIKDINYIADTYFMHPNYFRILDRPVLVLYVTRILDNTPGLLEEVLLLARTAAAKRGYDVYLIGDQAFGPAPTEDDAVEAKAFNYLDAVTNYDVYGKMGRGYASKKDVNDFYDVQKTWRKLAMAEDCAFIPSVTPGYNDRGVRLKVDHAPLSRKMSPTSPEGSFFSYSLSKALRQVDNSTGNLLLINSFNEWHEDTQIEPCVGLSTSEPFELTAGLEYEGYGHTYLDILKNMTSQLASFEGSEVQYQQPAEEVVDGRPQDDDSRTRPHRGHGKHREREYQVFKEDEDVGG